MLQLGFSSFRSDKCGSGGLCGDVQGTWGLVVNSLSIVILEFAWISVKKEKEGGKAPSVYMVSFLHQLVLHCEVGVYLI